MVPVEASVTVSTMIVNCVPSLTKSHSISIVQMSFSKQILFSFPGLPYWLEVLLQAVCFTLTPQLNPVPVIASLMADCLILNIFM